MKGCQLRCNLPPSGAGAERRLSSPTQKPGELRGRTTREERAEETREIIERVGGGSVLSVSGRNFNPPQYLRACACHTRANAHGYMSAQNNTQTPSIGLRVRGLFTGSGDVNRRRWPCSAPQGYVLMPCGAREISITLQLNSASPYRPRPIRRRLMVDGLELTEKPMVW